MDDVEKVKQKIDIVDFISEYLPLKKTGRNFKIQCPFHNEKTPSLVVSPERQIWHCFGCGKGGDIFTFLTEYEGIEFQEALKFLADKAGVKLSGPVFKTDGEKKREIIYSLNHLSASFYNYLLLSHPAGKSALSYFTDQRKIPIELIKKFNLGFAPNKNYSLTEYLIKKKGYKEEDLINAGLATKREGGMFDFFRNRIIFPIVDVRGNVIAFSGRALSENNPPKYINTRETLVYKKGDTLFGLNLAKDEIKKENRVIIVEGEFDVISSFREGIKNIVAVKGTALTENQIKVLKRYAEKISFCFDTDAAGVEAQKRSIGLIEKFSVVASVVIPPSGKDPDELIKEDPILFKKAIKNDINIYDFIIDSALKAFDANSADGKRKILDKTLPYLSLIENEVLKEHYLKKLAGKIDSSLESLTKQVEKIKNPQKEFVNVTPKKQTSREEMIEAYLLSLILQNEDPKKIFLISQEIIGDNPLSALSYNRLYKAISDFAKASDDFSIPNLVKILPSELTDSFDRCYLAPIPNFSDEEHFLSEVKKMASEIKKLSIKNRLKKLSEQIKEKEKEGKDKDLEKLNEEFNKLTGLLR